MGFDADRRLLALAAGQHGLFTIDQARQTGTSRDQLQRRVAAGVLERPSRGVYRFAARPSTWEARLLAACWAGGARSVASHRSAAALWAILGGRHGLVEITAPRWNRSIPAGVKVHELKRFDPSDLTVVDGIPVTAPALTLLQLAAVCTPNVVEMAFEQARNLGLVTHESCDDLLRRYSKQGRNGLTTLRQVLERRSGGTVPLRSQMETRMLQLIRRFGLPEPVSGYQLVRDDGSVVCTFDLAYPQFRIGIEYQSVEHHSLERKQARDRRRVHVARTFAWDVLEVGYDDVVHHGRLVHASIAQAIARAQRATA
jgi:predicted transcriptional regulator of viral defense system